MSYENYYALVKLDGEGVIQVGPKWSSEREFTDWLYNIFPSMNLLAVWSNPEAQ